MTANTPKTKIIRHLRSGRITIPVEYRRELRLETGSLLEVTLEGGELHIKPMQVSDTEQGSPWFRELYEYFAPVRQEAIDKGYTEEEINAWIDEAIAEVRAEHRGKSQAELRARLRATGNRHHLRRRVVGRPGQR